MTKLQVRQSHLSKLGWLLNQEKFNLIPAQRMRFSPAEDFSSSGKIEKIQSALKLVQSSLSIGACGRISSGASHCFNPGGSVGQATRSASLVKYAPEVVPSRSAGKNDQDRFRDKEVLYGDIETRKKTKKVSLGLFPWPSI